MDISIIIIVIGLFTLSRAILKSESLMKSVKGKFWTKLFGEKGARIFYILLGTGLITYSVLNYGNIIFP